MEQGLRDLLPPVEVREALYAALRGERVPEPRLWEPLVAATGAQGLLPNLYYALKPFAQQIPPDLRAALHLEYRQAIARSLRAHTQLRKILEALQKAGIEVAVLKGPSIAARYPDPALRSYGDIDLLVRDGALEPACGVLKQLGYALERPMDWMRKHYNHLPALVPEEGWPVELHSSPTVPGEPLEIRPEPLWGRLVGLQTERLRYRGLDPVDLVMYVVQHAFVHHRFAQGLRPLLDLGAITAAWPKETWTMLAQRADSSGWQVCLDLAFGLVGHILHQPRPDLGGAPLGGSKPDLAWAEQLLWTMPHASVDVTLVESMAQGGLSARLRRLLGYVFLPPEAMSRTYKFGIRDPRLWLSYLWRPFDLLRRHGRGFVAALSGDGVESRLWRTQLQVERWISGIE